MADRPPDDEMQHVIEDTLEAQERGERGGQSAVYSCPDCGGVLWQFDEPDGVKFGCHTGHRYLPDHLFARKSEALEAALFEAVRLLREQGILLRQLIPKTAEGTPARVWLRQRAEQQDAHAALIRAELLDDVSVEAGRQPDPAVDILAEVVRQMRRQPDD